jgi:proline iminopeptidase
MASQLYFCMAALALDVTNHLLTFSIQSYRVILFDQRGCGKSTPSAGDDDASPALINNTTAHLIRDLLLLRRELSIHGKMHVFGGSWGSTLALAYAIVHPETVQTLILRGVFLCRRADVDYLFQGNAADFTRDPLAMRVPGAYLDFPTASVSSPKSRPSIVMTWLAGWRRFLRGR